MQESFYLVATNRLGREWFQLRVVDTHYVLSCGEDLTLVLSSLRKFVKRHRTHDKLMRSLSKLEDRGEVSPLVLEQREEEYRSLSALYEDLVFNVVEETLKEVREEDRINSPFNKTRSILKKTKVLAKKTEEKTSPEKLRENNKVVLKRPRLLLGV